MGCGGSRPTDQSASYTVVGDDSGETVPEKIRPLLLRRLEELKKLGHANIFRGSQTLSKKELLKDGMVVDAFDEDEETRENDVSGTSVRSSKVAPVPPKENENGKEEEKEKKKEKEKENENENEKKKEKEKEKENENENEKESENKKEKEKKEKESENEETRSNEENGKRKEREETKVEEVGTVENVKNEKDVEEKEDTKKGGAKEDIKGGTKEDIKGEEEEEEEERLSIMEGSMICPGSPSFRVYCVDVSENETDNEEKDGKTDKEDGTDNQHHPNEESKTKPDNKKGKRGKRFRRVLPKKSSGKNLFNAKYYTPGCMGNHHTRLVQEKSI